MATHANSTPAPARRQSPPIVVDRRKIASAIERLIAILDELDADPDLEPNGDDEPSLGALETVAAHHHGSQVGWGTSSLNDCELAIDDSPHDEEEDGDAWELGSQRRRSYGAPIDLVDQHGAAYQLSPL